VVVSLNWCSSCSWERVHALLLLRAHHRLRLLNLSRCAPHPSKVIIIGQAVLGPFAWGGSGGYIPFVHSTTLVVFLRGPRVPVPFRNLTTLPLPGHLIPHYRWLDTELQLSSACVSWSLISEGDVFTDLMPGKTIHEYTYISSGVYQVIWSIQT
jgi:hypothetical protein